NPETPNSIPVAVDYHTADAEDVIDGLAPAVGFPGLRIYGDFKLHKMGSLMRNGRPAGADTSGTNVAVSESTDLMKTAELWDVGAVFPWGRDGRFTGTQLTDTILAHEGASITTAKVQLGKVTNTVVNGQTQTSQAVTICGIPTSAPLPVHLVLTGQITPGLTAINASLPSPDGGFRQGAQWLVNQIPSNGCVDLTLTFNNPSGAGPKFGLAIQDNVGYSEAVASVQGFKALPPLVQDQVIA